MNDEPDVLELLRKHSWHPIVQNAADEIDRLRAFVSDLAAQNESTVGLWEWPFFIGRAREATKGVS